MGELLGLVRFGTPVLVLGMLLYLVRIDEKIKSIAEDFKSIKNGVTWLDTCNDRHKTINRRLDVLEDQARKHSEE